MPLPNEVDLKEFKKPIRNLKRTDRAERKQPTYNGSFSYFDRLTFQVGNEQKQTISLVTKLITVHTGVFTYQPKIIHWIIVPEKP